MPTISVATNPNSSQEKYSAGAAAHLSGQRRELVIIDPHVDQWQILAAGVRPDCEIHILDPNRDGIEQITEILIGFGDQTPTPHPLHPTPPSSLHLISHGAHSGAPLSKGGWGDSSLHLISHGAPGTLCLGNSTLELSNLEKYRSQLQQWGISHLYIYGCQVAAGDAGTEFLQKLHHITQIPIYANPHPTGNTAKGGTWHLQPIQSPPFKGGLGGSPSPAPLPPCSPSPLSPHTLTTYPTPSVSAPKPPSLREAFRVPSP